MKGKEDSIESLRAVAIILVIGLHITNDPQIGEAQESYDYLAYTFQNIRIPLFTVISGYLYGLRPVSDGFFLKFVSGKSRRILLPLLVVSTLQFLSKAILPGVNNPSNLENLWTVLIFPYEHFWFLQVILLVFLFVASLDYFEVLAIFRTWLFAFVASIVLYVGYPHSGLDISIFSIGTTTYLLPYFLLGYGLANYSEILLSRSIVILILVVLACTLSAQQLMWMSADVSMASKRTVLGLCIALSASSLLFYVRTPIWGLSYIGSFAFTIYLYQGFGTAIGRRLGAAITDINPHVYFVLVILVSISFGILVEKVVAKLPVLRKFLLGLK